MKAYALLAIAACTRAPAGPTKPPETVVLFSELASREIVALKPTTEPQDFYSGCKLLNVKDYTVVQCPQWDFYLRFHCADHAGPQHALELTAKSEWVSLYCR